jgi:putative addiction module CopG family antidote
MTIRLTPEMEKFVDEQVKQGYYSSADEVLEAALARMMLDDLPERLDDATLAAINQGEEEIARGEDRPFKEVAAELRRKCLGEE